MNILHYLSGEGWDKSQEAVKIVITDLSPL